MAAAGGSYAGRRVAVTGGTGFIGSRLAERLAFEEGARVRVLVRDWRKATWVSRADVSLVPGDVTDPASLSALLEDAEIVFHCAATGGAPEPCHQVNVMGTRNVLEASARHGVRRVVHFSTVGVHGPRLHEGLDEDAPFRRLGWAYADSKIDAEEAVWAFLNRHSVEGVVLRPTYVWGPNSPWFTLQPVQLLREGRFYLVDGGRGRCNAVHVDNLVDLAIAAGTSPAAAGHAFLVRDDPPVTWGEFFAFYAAMVGVKVRRLPSVPSGRSARALTGRALLGGLRFGEAVLARVSNRVGPRAPALARQGVGSSRRLITRARRVVTRAFPTPWNAWDLEKFSASGYISIDTARRRLAYQPRVAIAEGMRECEAWLRDQAHL
jgi:nucleoside-diphosphate-sugar epimerase